MIRPLIVPEQVVCPDVQRGPERKLGGDLNSTVPDSANKPAGCPFHPRCDFAVAACSNALPEICDCGGGHLSRCPVLYDRKEQNLTRPL
ncbi:MAG: hypothetical protein IMF18_06950 [Proteobacteria bacterium]|nr:hypothetical protein [Pseudomonadota bacterium]